MSFRNVFEHPPADLKDKGMVIAAVVFTIIIIVIIRLKNNPNTQEVKYERFKKIILTRQHNVRVFGIGCLSTK